MVDQFQRYSYENCSDYEYIVSYAPVVSNHGKLRGRARSRGTGLERLRTTAVCLLGLGASDPRAWHRKGEDGMEGVHDSG